MVVVLDGHGIGIAASVLTDCGAAPEGRFR